MPILDHGGARRSDLSILDSVGPSTQKARPARTSAPSGPLSKRIPSAVRVTAHVVSEVRVPCSSGEEVWRCVQG